MAACSTGLSSNCFVVFGHYSIHENPVTKSDNNSMSQTWAFHMSLCHMQQDLGLCVCSLLFLSLARNNRNERLSCYYSNLWLDWYSPRKWCSEMKILPIKEQISWQPKHIFCFASFTYVKINFDIYVKTYLFLII